MEGERPAYGTKHRIYDLSGMAAMLIASACLAARIARADALRLWWVPVTFVIGVLAADLASGVIHWGFDTLGDEHTPVFGPWAIRAFREHHDDPQIMVAHDFVETNGSNFALAMLPAVGGVLLVPATNASGGAIIAGLCLLFTAIFVSLTSQIHKWAHMPDPPQLITKLQRAGLVLAPDHHAQHHAAPHRKAYCITVGWLDGFLDTIQIFPWLERLIDLFTRKRSDAR
jgi:plasmanylethanolamine desaturase